METKDKKETTLHSYRLHASLHLIPHIDRMRLQAVTPAHLETMYAEMLKSGRANGKGGLSPASVAAPMPSLTRRSPTPFAGG